MRTSVSLRGAVIALASMLGSSGLGCGDEDALLEIRIHAADKIPSRYHVALGTEGAELWQITCPEGAPSGPLRCGADGVSAGRSPSDAVLTVKAPGYSFVSMPISPDQRARGRVEVELTKLSPFEFTSDFRSGIAPENGEEAFLNLAVTTQTELGKAHAVKFYLADIREQPKVYFQNTRRYPLHYDFVRLGLGLPLPREVFERQTYYGEDRTAMAGTLVYYPSLSVPTDDSSGKLVHPVGLEFFPSDDLTPAQALTAHRLLEERLLWLGIDGGERRLVYVPAGSVQETALAAARRPFVQTDARFADRVQFYAGVDQQILNRGVAYGTLRRFSGDDISRAFVSFRDVALLTRLPNDLPLVGGTITEELQTPLAHVNLAARARGTPNLGLRNASADPRVAPFVDKLVRFEVMADGFSLRAATLEEAQAFWQGQARPPLEPTSDVEFRDLQGFGEIAFADSLRFGVKAANLSELKRALGDLAPTGFGVPFAAYHQYMSDNHVDDSSCDAARLDCEGEGRALDLCARARARCGAGASAGVSFYAYLDQLLRDAEFLADTPLREACLHGLRYLVEHGSVDSSFGAALDGRITDLFGALQIRLRSSSNTEDLPGFNGAGLYESLSAFGAGERRASLRIREVWGSLFTFRAFEERQFWNIDHRAVRMGIAVNPAIDDEAANGVLITRNIANPNSPGHYVNVQMGEIEVTNPQDGAIPEVFTIVFAPKAGFQVDRQRFSSLSPRKALLDDTEIQDLARAADRVDEHFAPLYGTGTEHPAMDIEFKFYGPERRLLIKQARPYSGSSAP